MLPEEMRELATMDLPLTWGVAEIQATADAQRQESGGTLHMGTQQGPEIAQRIAAHLRSTMGIAYIDVQGVYWSVPPATLYGLLDLIRTRLTLFVAELRATMPPGDQTPDGGLVARAVQAMGIHVTAGDYSPVVIVAPQAQADGGTADADASHNAADVPDTAALPESAPRRRFRRD
jgi:hypothetical protein